jgi:hypothetical protein
MCERHGYYLVIIEVGISVIVGLGLMGLAIIDSVEMFYESTSDHLFLAIVTDERLEC